MNRLFRKIAKVSLWRDSIPANAEAFTSQQLTPGQQLDITDLQIRFRIERSLASKTPDANDVYIGNLAARTRTDVESRPLTVQLEAGYDGVARLMFIGDLIFGMSEQDGPTYRTLLQVGDGDRTYNHSRCKRTYRSGTSFRTVLTDVTKTMGLRLPKNLADNPDIDKQFISGTVTHGPARDELTRLLAPFGYHWTIQHGELIVLSDSELSSIVALPVDQDHGMMGSPRFGSPPRSGKPPHVHIRNLLYPELMPGCLVRVTSEFVHGGSGLFRVEKTRHEGDTHSSSWQTEIEVKPL